MLFLVKKIAAITNDTRGSTYMEYALLGVLISVACAGALATLGVKVQALYTSLAAALP